MQYAACLVLTFGQLPAAMTGGVGFPSYWNVPQAFCLAGKVTGRQGYSQTTDSPLSTLLPTQSLQMQYDAHAPILRYFALRVK